MIYGMFPIYRRDIVQALMECRCIGVSPPSALVHPLARNYCTVVMPRVVLDPLFFFVLCA